MISDLYCLLLFPIDGTFSFQLPSVVTCIDTSKGSNLFNFIMSTSKREEVSSHLRYIRQELRDLDQMLGKHGLLPELSELKEVYNSLDALHQLLSGKIKKKPKPEFDD